MRFESRDDRLARGEAVEAVQFVHRRVSRALGVDTLDEVRIAVEQELGLRGSRC